MGSSETIKREFADADRVTRLAGFYRGRDGSQALVDVGDGRIPADYSGYLPELNEPVWVLFINGTATVFGPTQYKPDRGVFVATNAGLATVTTDAPPPLNSVRATYPLGQAFAVGQTVKLSWDGGPHIVSILAGAAPTPTVPGAPGNAVTDHDITFTAIDSGSYRSGWWTDDVWYATNNTPGAWFYGTKIRDTLPDTAAILEVWLYLRVTQASGSSPQIGTHPYAFRPGGAFSIDSKNTYSQVGGGFSGWVQLPNAVGDFLKANDGGIGTDGAGLRVFAGLGSDGQSGALRIKARY